MFEELLPLAEQVAAVLRAQHATIGIAESSTGGLLSAALLAIPGASDYFRGGSVIYTRYARTGLLDIEDSTMENMRASTEPYALLLALPARHRRESTWGVGERGAPRPTRYCYGGGGRPARVRG